MLKYALAASFVEYFQSVRIKDTFNRLLLYNEHIAAAGDPFEGKRRRNTRIE